jgi:hypothetical protein
MYAGVYEDAKKHGDAALQDQLAKSYLAFSDEVFAYSEKLSKQIMGYEPAQILLLHANQLEADHIGDLIEVMRKRGYRFVTLEDELGDPAYSLPTHIRKRGRRRMAKHWASPRQATNRTRISPAGHR